MGSTSQLLGQQLNVQQTCKPRSGVITHSTASVSQAGHT
jgi:hypothetical protein